MAKRPHLHARAADRAVHRYDAARAKGCVQFDDWFRAHFGVAPGEGLTAEQLRRRAQIARIKADTAETALRYRLDYERCREAALKAWAAQIEHLKGGRRGR